MGATLAPVLLRAVLAITFIWAGLGKIIPKMTIDSSQAAILASMGVEIPAAGPAGTPPNAPAPDAPTKPLPPPDADSPGSKPAADSPVAPTPAERAVNPDPATPTSPKPNSPAAGETASSRAPAPGEIKVRRMWGLALRLHGASHPGLDSAGKQQMKLWPAFLGNGNWPRYVTLAVVIAEIGGGVLVALGLLTRLGAFLLAGVMLGAVWLDQLGPAIQSGNTTLLVLPGHDVWDIAAWRPLLWQFSLFCSALALMLLGAGAPSLDRALGWMKGKGDDDDL